MGDFILGSRSYYFASICLIILAICMFAFMFEKRKPRAREIVVLSVMISLAIISRTIFFMTPQFKPMAAIVIITGVAFGRQSGFLCGALAAFLSNIFFGQGPWTPWQMIAFGLIGFFAGMIFHKSLEKKNVQRRELVLLCIYGVISIMLIYGLIMDSATVIMYTESPKVAAFIAAYATGFVYNVIHAVSVVIFLVLLAQPMIKKINRIKNKFGLFRDSVK